MNIDVKATIANHFAILGIDVDKDADLARGYFLISLLNACFGAKMPIHISKLVLYSYLQSEEASDPIWKL